MEVKIGQKLKALRQASDLTQEELANRAQLTKGFISQLENEQSSIGVDALADILEALGVTLAEFFTDSARPEIVFSPKDRIEVDDMDADKFELLVPGSTNNEMDPIMIELGPGRQMAPTEPFAGEKFGLVLRGTITLEINKKKYKIPRNSCFYFKAGETHQFLNNGKSVATMLMVVTPPQM